MKLRKSVKRLVESGPVDFMTLMQQAVKRARLNESVDGEEVDTTEGLDELSGSEEEGADIDDDFDGEDVEEAGDREMVTITIPIDATIEEITDAISAARSGDADDELEAEAEAAADAAADDLEAEVAADEALEDAEADSDEDFDEVEEDEEAFASTRAAGPVRKPASTTYKNQMTVDSNVSPTVSMGKPATIEDGSPKRRPASGTYDNNLTVRSKIDKGTRIFQ